MICTVDEAKTRWCPLARPVSTNKRIDNRNGALIPASYPPFNCVGDQCMWWVWTSTITHDKGYCSQGGG